MNYDQWKTTPPDYGNSHDANPDQAFWQAFRFAQRQGTVTRYLAIYRHTTRFVALVIQAEALLGHATDCECQVCLRVAV